MNARFRIGIYTINLLQKLAYTSNLTVNNLKWLPNVWNFEIFHLLLFENVPKFKYLGIIINKKEIPGRMHKA